MKSKIWLSSPHMGGKEFDYIKDAIDSNWVAPTGPNVDSFENELSQFLNENAHVAALSSGTAALHLGLILLGIKSGDEVICQSMTFAASVNPIAYVGATPILIDSEQDTWNMSPDLLEKAILDRVNKGKKPKAIIPVHIYGMPAKMDEISSIAAKYNIPILEDAAEALGSSINRKMCGAFGEISIFSFNGNKIITTSGGGALVSKYREHAHKARFLATQARDSAPHYQHSQIGYNYRMSNICASIGCAQMTVLPERILQRRNIFYQYFDKLSGYPGLSFLTEPPGYFSNRWLTTILIDTQKASGITRETLRVALEKENIESRPLWKPMHLQPVFEKCPFYGTNVSEKLFEQGLCLPSGSNLSESDMERIFDVIDAVWSKNNILVKNN
jgi:dTDP-4-amino-4,6-dideoxygalactose transaminase